MRDTMHYSYFTIGPEMQISGTDMHLMPGQQTMLCFRFSDGAKRELMVATRIGSSLRVRKATRGSVTTILPPYADTLELRVYTGNRQSPVVKLMRRY